MHKYVIFNDGHFSVVNIPKDFTSEQFGELQSRFAETTGECVSMRRLTESVFGVYYHWELAGPDGASFEVFKFHNTPQNMVDAAVYHLKNTQDVVRMKVHKLIHEHDLQPLVDRLYGKRPTRDFGTWHPGCGNGEGSVFDDREGARMALGPRGTTLTPICTVYDFGGDRDDLVRLIAAAPELLRALESFLRAPSIGSNGPGTATIVVQTYNIRAAEAAVAKATGR